MVSYANFTIVSWWRRLSLFTRKCWHTVLSPFWEQKGASMPAWLSRANQRRFDARERTVESAILHPILFNGSWRTYSQWNVLIITVGFQGRISQHAARGIRNARGCASAGDFLVLNLNNFSRNTLSIPHIEDKTLQGVRTPLFRNSRFLTMPIEFPYLVLMTLTVYSLGFRPITNPGEEETDRWK